MVEIEQRIRAARGFSGLSQPALAKRLEVSVGTMKRIELGQRAPKRSELLAIAEACKVPIWFLEHGWDGWMEAATPEELIQIANELPPPPDA